MVKVVQKIILLGFSVLFCVGLVFPTFGIAYELETVSVLVQENMLSEQEFQTIMPVAMTGTLTGNPTWLTNVTNNGQFVADAAPFPRGTVVTFDRVPTSGTTMRVRAGNLWKTVNINQVSGIQWQQ